MERIGDYLQPENDSLSLSLLRARANQLLARCVRRCNPYNHQGLVRVRLCLIDDPESTQVSITPEDALDEPVVEGVVAYKITATPGWIEASSDDEILAVWSHEIGHAVNGDLARAPRPTWMRLAIFAGPLACLSCGVLLALVMLKRDVFWPHVMMIGVVLFLLAYQIFVDAWRASCIRKSEYLADAYAARHGFAHDLLSDLSRDWSKMGWIARIHAYGPFAHHPTLNRRRRAVLCHLRGSR